MPLHCLRAAATPTANSIIQNQNGIYPIKLHRDLCQTPITALALYQTPAGKKVVLAGEDGDVVFYDTDTNLAVHRLPVFRRQPIHGIYVSSSDGSDAVVLVWGSSSVAAFPADYTQPLKVAHAVAPDWIYDGVISPFDSSKAILITAHNETVRLQYDITHNVIAIEDKIVSPSRPMLYTAKATWAARDEILVAAGTVFGDILVWKHHLQEDLPRMLFSLSGHEGSIFGVDLSPLLQLPDGSSIRLLMSCSDDRTIRVWNVTENDELSKPNTDTQVSTDTGFRCAPEYGNDNFDQGRIDVLPIAMEMGHASRIWGVKFALQTRSDKATDQIPIYSFGEDSTTQRWSLDLHAALRKPCRLSHKKTFSLHNGKHLWSRALIWEGKQAIIVTGGADSRISLINDTTETTTKSDSGLIVVEAPDVFEDVKASNSKRNAELIGRYDFLSHDDIIGITNTGRLAVGKFNDVGISWREIPLGDMAEDLKNCYVLRAVGHGAAVVGSTSGNLYYFHLPDVMVHVATLGGRIAEINALSPTSSKAEEVDVLVHLHGKSTSQYITLAKDTGKILSHIGAEGLDERFVAVSATKIGNLIAIGSRHGWLSILKRDGSSFKCILDFATRSRDAITTILPLPSIDNDPQAPIYILATSRDGKYRIYNLKLSNDTAKLHLIHETALPFGPMIEGAWFTKGPNPELVMYGFRSKDFVVWNESRREQIANMDCGGAHRTFRLSYSDDVLGRCRFAFTRTSKLLIHSQPDVAHTPLKLGTHGREIRAIASNEKIIATGAEDTSIRLWEYDSSEKQMRHLACMKTHVTGLQRLKWLGNEYLFSSGGNEEFFVWRVTQLKGSAYAGVAVVCEGVFQDKTPVGDLRIMDFDVSWVDGAVAIVMAFSNSSFKSYRYTPIAGTFELDHQGSYTGACLTQIQHLDNSSKGRILTASTDGHVCTWQSDSSTYRLVSSTRVHQSSIKSLDMAEVNENTYAILTGGDDNALGYLSFTLGQAGEFTIREEPVLVRSAHAAAINGAVMLRREGEIMAVSVSNDQQIKLWRVRQGLRLLAQAYSGVADAGDLVPVGEGVMLGGVGVEVWSLSQ